MEIYITTEDKRQVVDITSDVQKAISKATKAVSIFTLHTTCAITTADLDPGTDLDFLDAVFEMVPKLKYHHPHDPSHEHVHAHLASSLIGPQLTVPVTDGQLVLGAWQRIVLVELDGPRRRKITITNL